MEPQTGTTPPVRQALEPVELGVDRISSRLCHQRRHAGARSVFMRSTRRCLRWSGKLESTGPLIDRKLDEVAPWIRMSLSIARRSYRSDLFWGSPRPPQPRAQPQCGEVDRRGVNGCALALLEIAITCRSCWRLLDLSPNTLELSRERPFFFRHNRHRFALWYINDFSWSGRHCASGCRNGQLPLPERS